MIDPMISGTVGAILIAFLIVLGIAWFLLPFAMFGLKPRIDELTKETRKTNALLEQIRNGQQ